MNIEYNGTNEYKAIELLVPVDTEVVSVTVVRNGSDMPNRSTSIIASCFPADIDLHDCITGYSYRKDDEGKLYMVYDVDDEYEEVEVPEVEGIEDDEFDTFVKEKIDNKTSGDIFREKLDELDK